MPHTPRPDQRHELRKLREHFVDGAARLGKYISACGTGKTLVMAHLPQMLKANTVVVFVPSLNLVEQIWDAFDEQLEGRFDGAIVCSDDSRSRTSGARTARAKTSTGRPAYHPREKEDESDVWDGSETELLAHIGPGRGSVLHDPVEIAAMLDRAPTLGPPTIIFCVYHSSHVLLRGVRASGAKQVDLVLCDEAHRLVSDRVDLLESNDEDALEYFPRVVLKLLKARRKVFFTTTPKSVFVPRTLPNGKTVNAAFSMDDASLFGDDAHVYTYAQAVMDGVVAPMDIVVAHLDDSDPAAMADFTSAVAPMITKLKPGTTAADMIHHEELRAAVVSRVLDALCRKGTVTRALTYSTSIARAHHTADSLNALTPGTALAVSSKTPAKDRRAAIAALESGELPVIANCRLFGEGHNVPALDAIGFVDPKSSAIDIVQAVGRACRIPAGSDPGKRALVIIPVDTFDEDQHGNVLRRSDGKATVDTAAATRRSRSPFAVVQAVLAAMDSPGVGLHDCYGDFEDSLRHRFTLPRTPRGGHHSGIRPNPSNPIRDSTGMSVKELDALIGTETPDENPSYTEDQLLAAMPKVLSVAVDDPDPAAQVLSNGAAVAALTKYVHPEIVDKVKLTDAGFDVHASVLDLGKLSDESMMSEVLSSARFYRTLRAGANAVLRYDYTKRCSDSSQDTIDGRGVIAGLPFTEDPSGSTEIAALLGYGLAYALHCELVGRPPAIGTAACAPTGLPSRVIKHARDAVYVFDRLASLRWPQPWQLIIAREAGYPA